MTNHKHNGNAEHLAIAYVIHEMEIKTLKSTTTEHP